MFKILFASSVSIKNVSIPKGALGGKALGVSNAWPRPEMKFLAK